VNLSEFFIRRPVVTIVLSAMILLLGIMGAVNLSVRQYPKLDDTVITVTTTYPGASADLMQGFITTPIAQAVSSTENVDYVTSSSAQSVSTVSVHMRLGSNPSNALTEVLTKVQTVRSQLPTDAEDPIIQKGTGQNIALLYFAFLSDSRTPQQLTEYLTRVIQPRMATVPGVANAEVLGAKPFAMRIWLDPLRMASRGVTALDVAEAVRASNFLAAPGRIENEIYALYAETDTTIKTPELMGALPIRGSGNDIVRLRDVTRVELGVKNYDSSLLFQGRTVVGLGVFPTPEANPLDVARATNAEIKQIAQDLPQGISVESAFDNTVFIEASIDEVFKTLGEAVVIVVIVILVFLGSFRSVVIPIATIPLSLIGVCVILLALGYSINLLTLLAMVLAIGLVVDDAIVVVENVHRHIELGRTPLDAAIEGMREIFVPVIAMTTTLAAVYAPLGFTQGLTGALFREFAFTLAGSVIISGLIAVTLSPMMAARLLKPAHEGAQQGIAARIDRAFEGFSRRYYNLLHRVLDFRITLVALVGVLLGTTLFLFMNTPAELAPEEDQGALISILAGPRYASPAYMERYVHDIRAKVGTIEGLQGTFLAAGLDSVNSGFGFWRLKPWDDRKSSAKQIQEIITERLGGVAGLEAFVFSLPSLPGSGSGPPVSITVRTIGTPAEAWEMAEKIRTDAMASGRFIFLQNTVNYDLPRLKIKIDRDRAAALGVKISDIGSSLSLLLSNGYISRFDVENRSYDIVPQAGTGDRLNPEDLARYYVRSASGDMVPLSVVTTVETYAGPASIEQFNQLNSATLQGAAMPNVTNAQALQELKDLAAKNLTDGFFTDFSGESRLLQQEGSSTAIAFGLAVIVIYLVLAAQFESFRDPFIIMMAVPLSIFGAIIPLNLGASFQLTGASLNIYTQVGMITLIGLITKHGILLVEFANERRQSGMSRRAAIEEAARVRLRPILMTTAAMVLAVVPLITASGAGAAARFSMGLVIASGMSVGTLFTLFVVPTFYTFLSPAEWRPRVAGQVVEPHARDNLSGQPAE